MNKYKFVLLFIVLFSLVIRLWNITLIPPSLNWDEVSHGYNAYSILKTGKDEWGASMPHIFRAYGDYKLPIYVYLTALSEAFLGLTPIAVRLPSVLAGTLSVLLVYLLTKKMFKKESVAVLSSILMAIVPWSFFLSRAALEANIAIAFILFGVYFFYKGLENKIHLFLSVVFFGLSVYTYNSARVFTPLFMAAIVFIYRNDFCELLRKHRGYIVLLIFTTCLFFVPMLMQFGRGQALARYENVQILDQGAIAKIEELRNKSFFPNQLSRFLYNKATYISYTFASNYIKHFTPNFLFIKGGDHYQFSVPNQGLLYLVNLPFFFIGLFYLITKLGKNNEGRILIIWLILGPVAASVTRESPHVLRSLVMLPAILLTISLGISNFIKEGRWRLVFFAYVLILFISFADYLNIYQTEYRQNYSWSWQYGYKQVVSFVKTNYEKYEKIVITKKYGEPHEFILFYYPWEPEKFLSDSSKIQFYKSNWYWTDRFDKFYFVNEWNIPIIGSQFLLESGENFDCASCLLITSPGKAPENWKKLETVNFLDNSPAFEIYEH